MHINDIRNIFAHSAEPVDFSLTTIAGKCSQLELAKVAYFAEKNYDGNWFSLGQREARRLYLDAVTVILEGLILQQQRDSVEEHREPVLL